jgi:hypothetical protein
MAVSCTVGMKCMYRGIVNPNWPVQSRLTIPEDLKVREGLKVRTAKMRTLTAWERTVEDDSSQGGENSVSRVV